MKNSSELMGEILYLIFSICIANFMVALMVRGVNYFFNTSINLDLVSIILSMISIIGGIIFTIYSIIHFKKLLKTNNDSISEEDLDKYKEYKSFVQEFETKHPDLLNIQVNENPFFNSVKTMDTIIEPPPTIATPPICQDPDLDELTEIDDLESLKSSKLW